MLGYHSSSHLTLLDSNEWHVELKRDVRRELKRQVGLDRMRPAKGMSKTFVFPDMTSDQSAQNFH